MKGKFSRIQNVTVFSSCEKEKSLDFLRFSPQEMPVKLIYAYGDTDDIGYHKTLRGTKEVNLLNYMPRTSIPDSKYFDLTMTNVWLSYFMSHYSYWRWISYTPLFDH